MSFWDWFTSDKEYRTLIVQVPSIQISAIETLIYMERNRTLSRDLIVGEALDLYLKKKVWAVVEAKENVAEVKPVDSFGFRQQRKSPSN